MSVYNHNYTEVYKDRYIVRMNKADYRVFHKVTGKQDARQHFSSRQIAKLFIDKLNGQSLVEYSRTY